MGDLGFVDSFLEIFHLFFDKLKVIHILVALCRIPEFFQEAFPARVCSVNTLPIELSN
jgi:hypothetical protein